MSSPSYILLSWIARSNDPFPKNKPNSLGPTLSILFDEESPYRGKITKAYIFVRQVEGDDTCKMDLAAYHGVREAAAQHKPDVEFGLVPWRSGSPVDHKAIFSFIEQQVAFIRLKHPEKSLLIHVSPGTPAMQTAWVVLSEVGGISEPFEVVQSIPRDLRDLGEPSAIPVSIGLRSIYKRFAGVTAPTSDPTDSPTLWNFANAKSERLIEVAQRAKLFGKTKEPVLILGPRGSGKTTLAAWIRAHSSYYNDKVRDNWPTTHCGLFTDDDLLRSELFGHKAGSFTGAISDKEGVLSRIDKDTLFLDEIGDLRPTMQRMLMRALETGIYTPLGATQDQKSDFRLISATNRSLSEMRLRVEADFLDRISVLQLTMPALAEIREDLDWLWRGVYHSKVPAASRDLIPESLDNMILERLKADPLPGNLRDLQRVAVHLNLAVLAKEADLTKQDAEQSLSLALEREQDVPSDVTLAKAVTGAFTDDRSLKPILQAFGEIRTKEVKADLQRYLATELKKLADPIDRVDEISDITKRTLYSWLEEKTGL